MLALDEAQDHGAVPGEPSPVRSELSGAPQRAPVVGIGASAGGLPALQQLFAHLPPDSGMAFVVILHLPPQHESQAAEVLQRSASIPVTQVRATTTILPNHVYVIPPAKHLVMVDGTLQLREPEQADRRAPIDVFFRTLADIYGSHAACIVLSGASSDGTLGLARIKEHGGVTLAQDPLEAEHDSMPRCAIATGKVDFVLPVGAMPEKLIGYWQSGSELQASAVSDPTSSAASDLLDDMLTLLHARTGYDFGAYKRDFVLRRITHHQRVMGLDSLATYGELLRERPSMVEALARELLIGVTQFFRDPQAFAAVQAQVLPKLFAAKPAGEAVRAWVPGCATGEEAYSIAMLLCEYAGSQATQPQIRVFATDVDAQAIAIARAGRYPQTIGVDVPPQRLRRFFVRERGQYCVKPSLREVVVFAQRNLLRDPPISMLDLVSCRNVLIYLSRKAQSRLLRLFHFALRPGGYLFLGNFEFADGQLGLFTPLDEQHGIFVRRNIPAQLPRDLLSYRAST